MCFLSNKKSFIATIICGTLLSACGSGSNKKLLVDGSSFSPATNTSSSSSPAQAPTNTNLEWESGVFQSDSVFKNKCVSPRFNVTNPLTGNLYTDTQGAELDEKNWLRSWNNDVYLWYDEVTDQNPALFNGSIAEFFSTLKSDATTASGKPRDEFHFTRNTAEFLAENQSGITSGYGMTLTITSQEIPREIIISYTQPNSPATAANLNRGTKILEVDGVDLVNTTDNTEIATLNAGLFPRTDGETHTFKVLDNNSTEPREVTITSAQIILQPVQNTKVISTESGNVAYMQFNEHIGSSEQQLIDAIKEFKDQNVTDLVLDLRYNGGGLIYIASVLASMITGTDTTDNEIFQKTQFNDKHPTLDPFTGQPIFDFPFINTSINTSPQIQTLPHLNLSRLFVLTGAGTCSASELIINGLRGVNVEVIQIGETTCGKPYGFQPTDNCSTSYFTVNFRGVNAKGFGDYADGFSPENETQAFGVRLPGCAVSDDHSRQLGDPAEKRLAAALSYRSTGQCPALSARPSGVKALQKPVTVKPLWLQNAIIMN